MFKSGDLVELIGDHPWAGHYGTLFLYETYGVLNKQGWRIKLENGSQCYAQERDLKLVATKKEIKNG